MYRRNQKRRQKRHEMLRDGLKMLEGAGFVSGTMSDQIDAALHSVEAGSVWQDKLACEKPTKSFTIDWEKVPQVLDPIDFDACRLENARGLRKREQVSSLVEHIQSEFHLEPNTTLCFADIGAGSGHVGLLLGFLFPEATICFVDNNQGKLDMIKYRVEKCAETSSRNINALSFASIEALVESGIRVDITTSLHSCGLLTDMILQFCAQSGSQFCLTPCCYGQLQKLDPSNFWWMAYPFDETQKQCLKGIIAAADFEVFAHDSWETFPQSSRFFIAKQCMTIVDSLRLQKMQECCYQTSMANLYPLNCSPKNNVIVGKLRSQEACE